MKKTLLTILIVYQSAIIAGIGIGYSATGPLPVELTSFTGSIENNIIKLNWATATEIKNYGFEIERLIVCEENQHSANCNEWEKIGFVEGNGNSNSPKEYQFVDEKPVDGKQKFRLKQIDNDGTINYGKIIVEINFESHLVPPDEFTLFQNYPNPFNPTTKIKFGIPEKSISGESNLSSNVQLRIFDILGKEVAILINKNLDPGFYEVEWNASGFSSGMYFYQIVWNGKSEVKKLMLTK